MTRTVNNCLPIKKGERVNGMRTADTTPRDTTVNRNEWEGILGRLDVLVDEISRVLGRATVIEEPRSGVRISRTA
jgi:hypothetical protein